MLESRLPLLVVIGSLLLLALTGNFFSRSPVTIAAQVGAIGLSVWARRSFPRGTFRVEAVPADSALMKHGPYRFIRHPMYSAVLLLVWPAVLSHRSAWTVVVGVTVTATVVARVTAEERLLRIRYPDYAAYTRETKALVPFVI